MRHIFVAAFTTLGVMLYQIFIDKRQKNPFLYIFIFLFVIITNYFFANYVYAQEEIVNASLNQDQREYYFWKVCHHYGEAGVISRNAERWLDTCKENLSDNDYHLSNATIVGITTGTITKSVGSAAVAAAITLLQGLLHDIKKTWIEIKLNLRQVEYHIEMAEFYQDLLAIDGV